MEDRAPRTGETKGEKPRASPGRASSSGLSSPDCWGPGGVRALPHPPAQAQRSATHTRGQGGGLGRRAGPEHSRAAASQDLGSRKPISTKTPLQPDLGRRRLSGGSQGGAQASEVPSQLQGPPYRSPARPPRLAGAPVSPSRELQEGCSSRRGGVWEPWTS